jgi:predicted MFS family arabinose efflux permease
MTQENTTPTMTDIHVPAYSWYVLSVLFVVFVFNFLDRTILGVLLPLIKADLNISDTRLGLLSGFAFSLIYATLGLPVARLADRWNRRNVVALAITIWSAMTTLSGFATNFWSLFAARVGVGIGEAGATPPSHALLSDYFPPGKRATAFAIHALGVPLGLFAGMGIGGWVGEVYGWRMAFFVVGVPGLLVALLIMMTVREPLRGQADVVSEEAGKTFTLGATIRYFLRHKALVHLGVASGLQAFLTQGAIVWFPSFLDRSFSLSPGTIGWKIGLIVGLAGGLGTFVGGWLGDILGRRDPRWHMWLCALTVFPALPMGVFLYTSDNINLIFALFGGIYFLAGFFFGPAFASAQALVPLRMRALSSAFLLFLSNMIGLGLGPFFIGATADFLSVELGKEALRYAMLLSSVFALWSTYHYVCAARYVPAYRQNPARDLT